MDIQSDYPNPAEWLIIGKICLQTNWMVTFYFIQGAPKKVTP